MLVLKEERDHLVSRRNQEQDADEAVKEELDEHEKIREKEPIDENVTNQERFEDLQEERMQSEARILGLQKKCDEIKAKIEKEKMDQKQKELDYKKKEQANHEDLAETQAIRLQAIEERHDSVEVEVKLTNRKLVENTICIKNQTEELEKNIETRNDLALKGHALATIGCGPLEAHSSHFVIAEMPPEQITRLIPDSSLKLIPKMNRKQLMQFFTVCEQLHLYDNDAFYGGPSDLVQRHGSEMVDEMKIRALKAATVLGKINSDSVNGIVLRAFDEVLQAVKDQNPNRESSMASFCPFTPSPIKKTTSLKRSLSLASGSTNTPTGLKKMRSLSPLQSLSNTLPGHSLNQISTPGKSLYSSQSRRFTPRSGPSLSQSSFGDVSVSNLKLGDEKNYD
jgi:hypothetical protein